MKKIIFIVLMANIVFGQLNLDWTNNFHGEGYYNQGRFVEIDVDNNIIVAGRSYDTPYSSSNKMAVIKYSPDGTEVWSKADSLGDVLGLALDNSGNVFLCSQDRLLYYTFEGELLWSNNERTEDNTRYFYNAIKHDNHNNAIIVGSYNNTITTERGIYVSQFHNSGTITWQSLIEIPDSISISAPNKIEIDNNGSILLVSSGSVTNINGWYDCLVVIKLDAAGNLMWISTYKNPMGNFSGYYAPFELKLAFNGEIYVGANAVSTSGGENMFALYKFGTGGDLLFANETINNSHNSKGDMEVASDGSIYVCGSTTINDKICASLIKYQASGAIEWTYSNSYHTSAYAMTIDKDSNPIITANKLYGRAVITRFKSTSEIIDSTLVKDSDGNAKETYIWDATMDNENNLLLVGEQKTGLVFDLSTFKYSGVSTDVKVNKLNYEYTLFQNYPNPFNPSTAIEFSIPVSGNVSLKVYNTLGEEVAELLHNEMNAGYHSINFNATNLSSGIYFYRISSGNFTQTNKMLLIQ